MIDMQSLETELLAARNERDSIEARLAPVQDEIDRKVAEYKQSLMDAHEELFNEMAAAETRLLKATEAAKKAWLELWLAYRAHAQSTGSPDPAKTTPSGLLQVRVSSVAKILNSTLAIEWARVNCPAYLIETFKPSFVKAASQGLIPGLPSEAVIIEESYSVAAFIAR